MVKVTVESNQAYLLPLTIFDNCMALDSIVFNSPFHTALKVEAMERAKDVISQLAFKISRVLFLKEKRQKQYSFTNPRKMECHGTLVSGTDTYVISKLKE